MSEKTKVLQYADIIRAIDDIRHDEKRTVSNIFVLRDNPFHDDSIICINGHSDFLHGRNAELRNAILHALTNPELNAKIINGALDYLTKKAAETRPLAIEEAKKTIEEIPPLP